MKQQASMKLPKFLHFLEQNGFRLVRVSKHYIYQHTSGKTITVPNHSKDVGKLYIKDAEQIIGAKI